MKDVVSKLPDDVTGSKFDSVINLIDNHRITEEIEIDDIEKDRKGVVTGVRYYDKKAEKTSKASKRTLENHIYKK